VQAHLKQLPPAPSTEQATKNARTGRTGTGRVPVPGGNVEAPDSTFQAYTEGNLFRISSIQIID
jgi:hypothetical protein